MRSLIMQARSLLSFTANLCLYFAKSVLKKHNNKNQFECGNDKWSFVNSVMILRKFFLNEGNVSPMAQVDVGTMQGIRPGRTVARKFSIGGLCFSAGNGGLTL